MASQTSTNLQAWGMPENFIFLCVFLASSPKLCHKKFLHFVELMVKSAEDHGQKVPVRDPLTGTKLGRSQSTKPANVGEGDDFEVIFDFEDSEDAQTQTNLRRIEAKSVFLEKALRRVTEALNMDPEEQWDPMNEEGQFWDIWKALADQGKKLWKSVVSGTFGGTQNY